MFFFFKLTERPGARCMHGHGHYAVASWSAASRSASRSHAKHYREIRLDGMDPIQSPEQLDRTDGREFRLELHDRGHRSRNCSSPSSTKSVRGVRLSSEDALQGF